MRVPILFALLLSAAPSSFAADDNNFSGAWTAWVCAAGVRPESGKCPNFVLELFQKQDRVCGAHVYATAGAGEIDEGAAPSLTGSIANDVANVVVESSRSDPPVRVPVELKMLNGRLQWTRLEDPAGNYLLPRSVTLTRSKHGTLFHPVFAQQLMAVCSTTQNNPIKNAAPATSSQANPGTAPASR